MLSLTDPIVLKAAAGGALYAFSSSRPLRMAGLALAGWAAWEYFSAPKPKPLQLVPLDPDAPMPLTGAQSIRAPGPLFPGAQPSQGAPEGDSDGTGGKVIPFRQVSQEDRAMFYGIEEGSDDAR